MQKKLHEAGFKLVNLTLSELGDVKPFILHYEHMLIVWTKDSNLSFISRTAEEGHRGVSSWRRSKAKATGNDLFSEFVVSKLQRIDLAPRLGKCKQIRHLDYLPKSDRDGIQF